MTLQVVSEDYDNESLSRLREWYRTVRRRSDEIAAPLPVEDQVVQTMPDVSPTKWHLAHTSWFFEIFVAEPYLEDYEPFREGFDYLFNSYYRGAGRFFERSDRGTIGRPTVETIREYRQYVDEAVDRLFEQERPGGKWARLLQAGLHHECQHQELMLTDIKHVLAHNPLRPAYRHDCASPSSVDTTEDAAPMEWIEVEGGVDEIGYDGSGFAFDNEQPRHQVMLEDFAIASRPVLCGEYIDFIEDGGYDEPEWWLSEGWNRVEEQGWEGPLYWQRRNGEWWTMTLGGMRRVDRGEPVCHVSYFEADAYARWAGARLPTEAQWEVGSRCQKIEGNFLGEDHLHPITPSRASVADGTDFFGNVWEWTASPYTPYPGYQPWEGSLGEYNGKFMCNQYVLRGGSCVTPIEQIRRSYRNFFAPDARWQFTGFRLADESGR